MAEANISYSDKKKLEIKEAIEKMESSSAEFGKVGFPESQLNIGVTRKNSKIANKVLNGEDGLQRFPNVKYKKNDYITFSFPQDTDLASLADKS